MIIEDIETIKTIVTIETIVAIETIKKLKFYLISSQQIL